MQKTGCKQWGNVEGIRGAWCWIDEKTTKTGVVITFLSRFALDEFCFKAEI